MLQKTKIVLQGAVTLSLLGCLTVGSMPAEEIPRLQRNGQAIQLMVAGKPFLMLGGELGNSTASHRNAMDSAWNRITRQNVNTVLAPIYWELLEPKEGQFDFDLVDGLIYGARQRDTRLVLLWFGAWKNSMSSYVPGWVKRDYERFPRARNQAGDPIEMLTAFSQENRDADQRAFVALMNHLRNVDSEERTVIMVQVENEIGMIPDSREHGREANAAFESEVPQELLAYLRKHKDTLHPRLVEQWQTSEFAESGSWPEVFGRDVWTDELFMAWHYARYVESLTVAGKSEYPLPMYANAALVRPDHQPGRYPSAGPLPHLIDVWRAGSPSLDFIAPDIYFPNFVEWSTAYAVPDNALFIPETTRGPVSAANAMFAFGELDAMGFSPFSIENAEDDSIGNAYATLTELTPLIVEHQAKGTIAGVRPPVNFLGETDHSPQTFELGDYKITATFVDPWTPTENQNYSEHGGLILALDNRSYFVAGTGITLTFEAKDSRFVAGIETIEEGHFIDGVWTKRRVLNGDQSHQGRHLRLPPGPMGIQKLVLYNYR